MTYSGGKLKIKHITTYIIIITMGLSSSNTTWVESDGLFHSSNEIIIKLNSDISPKLGLEPALNLETRSDLFSRLSKWGVVESFKPIFKFHDDFNAKHWEFSLHQFYVVTFTKSVDINKIIESIQNHPDISHVNPNYRAEAFLVPNDPLYELQWAHDNTGQAISYGGGNVGTPDCDTDSDFAWDITQGSSDVIISMESPFFKTVFRGTIFPLTLAPLQWSPTCV